MPLQLLQSPPIQYFYSDCTVFRRSLIARIEFLLTLRGRFTSSLGTRTTVRQPVHFCASVRSSTMIPGSEEWLHSLTSPLRPPFNRVYKGISYCHYCRKTSLFPDLSFCHGMYHQTRRSQCVKRYFINVSGEVVDDIFEQGGTSDPRVRAADKALHERVTTSIERPAGH